jgi:hypothetical protein
MADITMCEGLDKDTSNQCNTCYRKTATPNMRQAWFFDVPLKDPEVTCQFYLDNKVYANIDSGHRN